MDGDMDGGTGGEMDMTGGHGGLRLERTPSSQSSRRGGVIPPPFSSTSAQEYPESKIMTCDKS